MILTQSNLDKEIFKMKRQKHTLPVIALTLLTSLFFCLPGFAADTIKQRMMERIPALTSLKSQGVIGENNKGFLEFREQNPGKQDLVNAENSDRRQVYSAIAKQQGASPELVGSRRAKQIAEKAAPGTWVQKADGKWFKK